jgi:hypothetical protein
MDDPQVPPESNSPPRLLPWKAVEKRTGLGRRRLRRAVDSGALVPVVPSSRGSAALFAPATVDAFMRGEHPIPPQQKKAKPRKPVKRSCTVRRQFPKAG